MAGILIEELKDFYKKQYKNMGKLIDFRPLNIRVDDNLKAIMNKKKIGFVIKAVYMEHIPYQIDQIEKLNVAKIKVGDSMKLDTYFGYCHEGEWITFPLKGVFKINEIFTIAEIFEIKITIPTIRISFLKKNYL